MKVEFSVYHISKTDTVADQIADFLFKQGVHNPEARKVIEDCILQNTVFTQKIDWYFQQPVEFQWNMCFLGDKIYFYDRKDLVGENSWAAWRDFLTHPHITISRYIDSEEREISREEFSALVDEYGWAIWRG